MKTKKEKIKELTDFQIYLRKPGVDNMRSDEVRATNFLSVNSEHETDGHRALKDNKAKKELCECVLPHSDSDNECCRICGKFLDLDD